MTFTSKTGSDIAVDVVDPAVLRAWLQTSEVVGRDGGVASWTNREHPGYRYPEIAGLLLNLLARDPNSDAALRRRIAVGLAADTFHDGGIGRAGIRYVFDGAMALSGLMAELQATGSLPDSELPHRLFGFLDSSLRARRAATSPTSGRDAHWSTTYGCHLLKVALALTAYRNEYDDPGAGELIEQLVTDLAPLSDGGRFRIHAESDTTYLHAHCYAIEGLLATSVDNPATDLWCSITSGATWLAAVQEVSGGLRAWHTGEFAHGEFRADATAQAVRIWCLVDRVAFRREIAAGLRFLASVASGGRGVRYSPDSADVNVWATIFAVQASEWSERRGDPLWIA